MVQKSIKGMEVGTVGSTNLYVSPSLAQQMDFLLHSGFAEDTLVYLFVLKGNLEKTFSNTGLHKIWKNTL